MQKPCQPFEENGRCVVRYVGGEDEANAAASQDTLRAALSLAGAWADMDGEEAGKNSTAFAIRATRRHRSPIYETVLAGYGAPVSVVRAPNAVELIRPWILQRQVATSLVVDAEVSEDLPGRPDPQRRQDQQRTLLPEVTPYVLTFPILERCAAVRRQLRPPVGAGLIGDIDTLIAATALEHNLAVVTMDADFQRVPSLSVEVLPRFS